MKTQTRVAAWMLTLFCLAGPAHGQTSDSIIPDVVYGHKDGMALTFDVFRPPGEPNGAGILFMVSGGWVSRWTAPADARSGFEPLLNRGFTVFSVRHGSSPRFTVPEAYADVQRAVRFVRLHARTRWTEVTASVCSAVAISPMKCRNRCCTSRMIDVLRRVLRSCQITSMS